MTAALCITLAAALGVGIATQVSVIRQSIKRIKERAYWDGWTDAKLDRFPQEETKI